MVASGERFDFADLRRPGSRPPTRPGRQALHRRCRRQDHHPVGAGGDGLRWRGTAGGRPRPGPHRGHARQTGVHPGLHRRALQIPDPPTTLRLRRGRLRRRGARPGRPQDLCAARRHRHHGVAAADRELGDEQEDRRGHPGAGARHQGRLGRVPHHGGRVARAGPHDGRPRRRARAGDPRAADRHGRAAGSSGRQRGGGRRVAGGAGRRRARRRRRADAGAGAGDARRGGSRRRGPGPDPARRVGDGPVPRAGRRAGRGPRRAVAARRAQRDRHGAARWHDGGHRRDGGGTGGVAARSGPLGAR